MISIVSSNEDSEVPHVLREDRDGPHVVLENGDGPHIAREDNDDPHVIREDSEGPQFIREDTEDPHIPCDDVRPSSNPEAEMRLWAIADIHLSFKGNKDEWAKLRARRVEINGKKHLTDGLILAGDVGETIDHLKEAFRKATRRFKHVFWVPGNHELYTSTAPTIKVSERALRGEAKYRRCIDVARKYGVLTPEDEYMTWTYTGTDGTSERALICPIFTLYDYSFRPDHVSREDALAWALEEGIQATDEKLLHPDPYATRDAWCTRLVSESEAKLEKAAARGLPLVIINHWPLREDTIFIPRVPRFSLWCGTKETADWHTRFGAKVVVTGHLHVRRTDWIDGVRFEEVSLGYPKQWSDAKAVGNDVNTMMREILPGPPSPPRNQEPSTQWRRFGPEPEAGPLFLEQYDNY